MGENKHIKELDAFAKKYVKEIKAEKPSIDFTASIMQTIAEEKTADVFKTTALISKKVWFLILGLLAAAIFIPFKESKGTSLNMPEIHFSFLEKIQISNLFESISVSNTVLYSVFFFGLMVIAQVVFLKNHFDKRYH
ncbi:hypothetical protein H9W90_07840 [Polaribacter pectinis]|uniref:Uncharacterized protein n=1 Tax=Polaribacter pectinis TaxID=2738844 RepID=A0A7G9LEG4_9FLAO|nr:hypothetical protein [Polaribacter pectinis]QNM87013.1 hypothetical protein H9W90_07840 [Polaribacter pectinis]